MKDANCDDAYVKVAIYDAIEAINKQYGVEAMRETSHRGRILYKCPTCDCLVPVRSHHCICGQKLSWNSVDAKWKE